MLILALNIKTAHHIFESGIIQRESVSELAGMVVEYEGKFYEIGSTHKEYQMDKVWDEDYYILTLAALAKELRERGLCYASVILAVGLPIKWLGEQAEGEGNTGFSEKKLGKGIAFEM